MIALFRKFDDKAWKPV